MKTAFKRIVPLLLAITLLSGAKLEVTPEHPFWLADGIGGWVPASQLKGRHLLIERIPGEGEKPAVVIYGQNGQALPADVVMSVEERTGSFTVHNMIVEDWHSYVVAGGVVVHNGSCKLPTFKHLKDHAKRHSNLSPAEYYESAVKNIDTGKKFNFRHDGQNKIAYLTRIGEDSYSFTSTSKSGNQIFTHMDVTEGYLKNIGITLPRGF